MRRETAILLMRDITGIYALTLVAIPGASDFG
jgi:hypothetical protein